MDVVDYYNNLMARAGRYSRTIGTKYSEEGIDEWNIRDVVSEAQYTLDRLKNPASIAYIEAHSLNQPSDRSYYIRWCELVDDLEEFIDVLAELAEQTHCTCFHLSCWDG